MFPKNVLLVPAVHQTFTTLLGSKYSNGKKKVSTSICAILEEVKLLLKTRYATTNYTTYAITKDPTSALLLKGLFSVLV